MDIFIYIYHLKFNETMRPRNTILVLLLFFDIFIDIIIFVQVLKRMFFFYKLNNIHMRVASLI